MAQVLPRGSSAGADASVARYASASRLDLYRHLPPLFSAWARLSLLPEMKRQQGERGSLSDEREASLASEAMDLILGRGKRSKH